MVELGFEEREKLLLRLWTVFTNVHVCFLSVSS
jgi:hypothetical protein